mmetsp:Transcript_25628/g.35682  ORF Transcript_25628/g.35682 Transcript_25628/m.35682 type:complete len:191 (-) Transcript_25628:109-681(-)
MSEVGDTLNSQDVQFLDNFRDIFAFLTAWTVTIVAIWFFMAGLLVTHNNGWICTTTAPTLLIPFAYCALGIAVGLYDGVPMAAIIAALYRAVPYSPGVDIATGLGIAQAIVIIYLHMGGAVFIHYFSCNPEEDLEEDEEREKFQKENHIFENEKKKTGIKHRRDRWLPYIHHRPKFYRTGRIKLFENYYY